jgi:hypothetical protein
MVGSDCCRLVVSLVSLSEDEQDGFLKIYEQIRILRVLFIYLLTPLVARSVVKLAWFVDLRGGVASVASRRSRDRRAGEGMFCAF